MMNLTSLNCCRVGFLHDTDLTLIAESFPMLQELDISYPEQGSSTGSSDRKPISDSGVLSLAMNLKSLRRINLSGNDFITDMSLLHLAKNCVLLTQVVIYECEFITHNGVAKLIRVCGHLNSVLFCGVGKPMIYRLGSLSLGCPWKSSKALCVVDFSDTVVPDELLCLVAEACFPMKKIVLSNCVDNDIFELSKSLGSITYINLSYCHRLTSVTLDTLVRNCRVLNVIIMVGTNAGAEALETDVVPNLGVKILNLSQNRLMGNGVIANYVSVFPNLEMLNLSDCVNITEDGIVEVLKRCSRIRHLEISRCGLIENLLIDFELPKLEVLCARGLIIDDDGLTIIGKRCPRLQKLDLSACMEVTAKGVKEVVAYCKEIREIKLRSCTKFSYDIIPWMLLSRPSLKTIVLPSASFRSLPNECQRKHIVHEGVLVCDD
ncbi:hypothetical protein ACLB2K_063113 [Fragaria x ananassa]